MKKTFQGLGILLLIYSLIFFTSINDGSEISQKETFESVEKSKDSKPVISDWEGHLNQDGLIERRSESGEITDQKKIPTNGSNYFLLVTYQNLGRDELTKNFLSFDFSLQRDRPVFYHNLRI
jgi:hypothetical protein